MLHHDLVLAAGAGRQEEVCGTGKDDRGIRFDLECSPEGIGGEKWLIKNTKKTEGLPQPPPEIVIAETKDPVRLEKGSAYPFRNRHFPVDLLHACMAGRNRSRRKAFPIATTGEGCRRSFPFGQHMVDI